MQDVHGVDLLQAAVLGLDHKEEDNEDESRTASSKYETVPVVNGIGDEASAVVEISVLCIGKSRLMQTYKNEIIKFQNQLDAVARAMAGAL